jgi:hypothetical protein
MGSVWSTLLAVNMKLAVHNRKLLGIPLLAIVVTDLTTSWSTAASALLQVRAAAALCFLECLEVLLPKLMILGFWARLGLMSLVATIPTLVNLLNN